MNIVLSYIGKMPEYIIDCIHQIRLFSNLDIFVIMNDMKTPHLLELSKFNVKVIQYKNVHSREFNECLKKNSHKFLSCEHNDREELFIRSIERFYILQNAMKQYNLSDILFMELDNLIYDNPEKWLSEFKKHHLCFMFDNIDRCSSGIMYVKDSNIMQSMLDFFINHINESTNNDINEMYLLFQYYMHVKNNNLVDIIQLLPTYWSDQNPRFEQRIESYQSEELVVDDENTMDYATKNYGKYDNTIFDAAAIGIHLFGVDSCLLNNEDFQKNYKTDKWNLSYIDYTKHEIKWKLDNEERLIPYIFTGVQWNKINNLHLHCKNLKLGLSKQYQLQN